MNQSAARHSLTEYSIYTPSGALQSEINLQRRLFTASDAPLTPTIASLGLADAPTVIVLDQPYLLCKALRSDKFFANRFDLSLQGLEPTETPAITASYGQRRWATLIQHEGREYLLKPKSWFGFKFELAHGEAEAARFIDASPFLSFSSKRSYRIDLPAGPQPPLLIAFAFLLAVSSTYRLAL